MSKQTQKSGFLYKDLSYQIRGCIFNVHNKLGPGHKERVYHNALKKEFKDQSLVFNSEKVVDVLYEGEKVGAYKPDFVVDNKIIIEIKAVDHMPKVYEKQLISYLQGSPYKVAFLVNFGGGKAEIRRRVDTNK